MSSTQVQEERISFDVIVIGAGLAGSSAAAVAARAGLKVALIERGQYAGGKNFFGGAVYTMRWKRSTRTCGIESRPWNGRSPRPVSGSFPRTA
jgi:flavin-dependent dehydrogenase